MRHIHGLAYDIGGYDLGHAAPTPCHDRSGVGLCRWRTRRSWQILCGQSYLRVILQYGVFHSERSDNSTNAQSLQLCKRRRRCSLGLLYPCISCCCRTTLRYRGRMPIFARSARVYYRLWSNHLATSGIPTPDLLDSISYGEICRI